ncbi:MAG: hypothetical protein G01um101425_619 [Candidatus Peregrinibacteria bacterium Gr01-1014_25]|nr:MAG: hypothetical protein G01um101425_619 [Candidatus Peregrinibacteria bacterium Gr01-1014_25]
MMRKHPPARPSKRSRSRKRSAARTVHPLVSWGGTGMVISLLAVAAIVFAVGPEHVQADVLSSSSQQRSVTRILTLPRRVLRHLGVVRDAPLSAPISRRDARRAERLRTQSASSSPESSTSSAPEPPPQNPYSQIGVYLTAQSGGNADFVQTTLDALQSAGGTTFVLDVKGHWVYYHSQAAMARDIDIIRPAYELPDILARAKARGMYTIVRYIAIKDEGFTERRSDAQLKHKTKGYPVGLGWSDPANPIAQEYNQQLICELAMMSDLDEINLDYIRFSSYMPYSTGYSGDEKAERLLSFLRMTRETIDRCGSHVKLGVSTYAILGWSFAINRETIGQDIIAYAPLVDVISPMAYPATFTSAGYYVPGQHPRSRPYWLVYRTLTGYRALLGPEQEKKLRPWIQAYSFAAKDIKDEMDAVVDAGLCGFTFWNANNNYGPTLQALGTWAQPDRCKTGTVSVEAPKLGMLL